VGDLALGDLIAASEAIAADGASRALGTGERVAADPELTSALAAGADVTAPVVSTDLFYDPEPSRMDGWRAAGAVAVEMEAAALLAVAGRHDVRAGCVLMVTDLLADGGRERIDHEEIEARSGRLGEVALSALTATAAG
jgi:purine-nucleoside phosphorylase